MKYLVAVSGGVDSVVLLDMLVKVKNSDGKASVNSISSSYRPKESGAARSESLETIAQRLNDSTDLPEVLPEQIEDIIVAHFDHGIRDDSGADARFVAGLAAHYELPFVSKREELGPTASEDEARRHRYEFLREQAKKYKATIVTAHHADDVVETIAINLIRGTGWRGLAVLGDEKIVRPLLEKRKSELYDYALAHSLEWVEDATNQTDRYLRNRLRHQISKLLEENSRRQLLTLNVAQKGLTAKIDNETKQILTGGNKTSRYFFTAIDHLSALELIRGLTKTRLTRPQAERLLLAIKTARTNSRVEPGGGLDVKVGAREFFIV